MPSFVDLLCYISQLLPVLSTFAKLVRQPELGRIPFIGRIIGTEPPPQSMPQLPSPSPRAAIKSVKSYAKDAITYALQRSTIEPVTTQPPTPLSDIYSCTMYTLGSFCLYFVYIYIDT